MQSRSPSPPCLCNAARPARAAVTPVPAARPVWLTTPPAPSVRWEGGIWPVRVGRDSTQILGSNVENTIKVGLWPWPPHSTSFHSVLRIVHPMRPAQPALSDDFREKIKQTNPSGWLVCPSSPSSGPSFSLPSVSAQRTSIWFFFYVLQMISHEQDPYRLDSVIMHPAITICQGTSAPRTSYRPCGSLRQHSCGHQICLPIDKHKRAVVLLVSNCKTSIPSRRRGA